MNRLLLSAASCLMVAGAVSLPAGVIYDGGTGGTSYGATQYVCPGAPGPCTPPGPQFGIVNNFTGRNDILTCRAVAIRLRTRSLGTMLPARVWSMLLIRLAGPAVSARWMGRHSVRVSR